MIVKGTTDFIRLFMLKNHIEYLDGDGWNEIFYHELDEDERELAMDLTPIYEYLLQYVGESVVRKLEDEGKHVEYINHVGVDMETERLFMIIQFVDGDQEEVIIQ